MAAKILEPRRPHRELVLSMSDHLGSVKPIVPKYETPGKPWEPQVDGSDDVQKAAADDYASYYGGTPLPSDGSGDSDPPEKSGNEPILKMAYTTAPDIRPLRDDGSSDGASTAMESGRFYINLSTLRSSEQRCLDATSQSIDGYETLKDEVNKAVGDDNFFGQDVGFTQGTVQTGSMTLQGGWRGDPGDDAAQQFADATIPQMKNLLNAIGNAIEAMGGFTALITDAGQSYATMDHKAAFPPDGPFDA
ncbi:hypothetical protein [Actinoallomurus rhizosphaericola]|uniref:hypothetical protein n=1 Tax=Actinoallomurus rhizosphaericola TaxID=2952536 RepID=UPI002093B576|nr:hypothetical protein [Actinoallomurus rhizosphaericola]MCO6000296.1 hypothetical protein [Actinoallomurus rhizosphaericola]